MTVKLGELPNPKEQAKAEDGTSKECPGGSDAREPRRRIGQTVGLSPATKELLLPTSAHPVRRADSGLRRGDVIQEVNHQPVKNVSELNEAIHKAGKNPLLLVNRQGSTISSPLSGVFYPSSGCRLQSSRLSRQLHLLPQMHTG